MQKELPQDFVKKMKALLQEEWEEFLYSYEHDRYQALRFSPLKKGLKPEDYERILGQFSNQDRAHEHVAWAEHGFYYENEARPGKHPYHEAGAYYIQEPSAMSAAALLAPKPGMRVLDLCAAPGGKTTQLAGYMAQKGLLVANEIHPARCKILSQNVERMGIENAIVTNEDSAKLAECFPSYFHAILVDAPCSGEGMFRKNPEAVDEWSMENVMVCAKRQRKILDNAAGMLLPGGTMVYSTCTFSPEENEQTIEAFLAGHPEFEIQKVDAPWFSHGLGAGSICDTFRLWPHKLHGEGHFAAVLRKKGMLPKDWMQPDEAAGKKGRAGFKSDCMAMLDKAQKEALREFFDASLSVQTAQRILDGDFVLFKDQLYRLPQHAPSLRGLRVLRAGLHIGEFKKNRFEPSHALALALGSKDVVGWLDFPADSPNVLAYLRGESISAECQNDIPKGWCLVGVDGYSLGWGKYAGGQLKNHYPKGLRRNLED